MGLSRGLGGKCDFGLGGRSCRPWWFAVAEPCAEHGVDDVAAAAGEADDGGVVLLAFRAFAGVVVARGVVVEEQKADSHMAFLSRWLPRRLRVSPLSELPDWRVTGARPA
jgi:hypothetical protein